MRISAGARIFVLGRTTGPPGWIEKALESAGATLVPRCSRAVTHTVVAHAAAASWRERKVAGELVSELAFRRALGLHVPADPGERRFSATDVVAHSKLSEQDIKDLVLFDVLDPVDGRFGFVDIACAREAARLLAEGSTLDDICAAGARLRERGLRLTAGRLCGTPWGALAVRDAEQFGDLDGQLALGLEEAPAWAEALFEEAEIAEEDGDLARAESLYRQAMHADKKDPAIPFNLGNILQQRGRTDEAIGAYLSAIKRDPNCADAFYNMAILRTTRRQEPEAERCYRAALEIDPDHLGSLFNLALLLTRCERYADALPLWERAAEIDGDRQDATRARRSAQLCRMALHAARQSS